MEDILIVDAHIEQAVELAAALGDLGAVWRVAGSLAECLEQIEVEMPGLIVIADKLPDGRGVQLLEADGCGCDVVVIGDQMTPTHLLDSIALGAKDYVVRPIAQRILEGWIATLRIQGKCSSRCEPAHMPGIAGSGMVVGACAGMLDALKTAGMAAKTSASVIINGESGTGKDLMAREIHRTSGRSGAFVALNCAAVAEGIAESELFGHERGAFTGAVARRAGCFEQAHGGTLFLDEIGEAPPSFQAKLLRALDQGEVVRVGGQASISTDVRVVAATNRDLEAMVACGDFRLDLFYRLSAVTIALPPLRERREDIPCIITAMLGRLKTDFRLEVQGVSEAAVEYLVGYDWPGNIRELQHAIHRAALACRKGVIQPMHFGQLKTRDTSQKSRIETLYEVEQAHIERVLAATGGNQGRACQLLGVSRPTLRRKIRRYASTRKQGVEFDLDLQDASPDN